MRRVQMLQSDQMSKVIEVWKSDPNVSYSTWFLWEERLKNFRSIRTCVKKVIQEIEQGRFGNSDR